MSDKKNKILQIKILLFKKKNDTYKIIMHVKITLKRKKDIIVISTCNCCASLEYKIKIEK